MSALVVERGPITTVTVDRPAARNAIDRATLEAFVALVDELQLAPPRALILTGAGRRFVSGADIKDFRLDEPSDGPRLSRTMHDALTRLSELPTISIAALDGDAHGGGWELAVACDLRVVVEGASFVFRQVEMGLVPGWGGGPRLQRLVGPGRALWWLASAATVTAREAEQAGLVERVAVSSALDEAQALAARIASLPEAPIGAVKAALRAAADRPLTEALGLEADTFSRLWGGPDHRAAVARFLGRTRT